MIEPKIPTFTQSTISYYQADGQFNAHVVNSDGTTQDLIGFDAIRNYHRMAIGILDAVQGEMAQK